MCDTKVLKINQSQQCKPICKANLTTCKISRSTINFSVNIPQQLPSAVQWRYSSQLNFAIANET